MNSVQKAIWFIESHFADDISLDDIAGVAGVSRHHIVRAFGAVTGRSVMRYVRARRLSEAARLLAQGAPDILEVALQAGYGSHEAFTRAFRDQFGITPDVVRAQRHTTTLELVEPIKMSESVTATLPLPRFEQGRPLLIAGLVERFNDQTAAGIPALWQRFQPHIGHIPGQLGRTAYGVCIGTDEAGNIDYMAGVEVAGAADLPAGLTRLRIPAQRYAVFAHADHISRIRGTWAAIWAQWLPESGHEPAGALSFERISFERYDEAFDPLTGNGGVEIWVALAG